MHFLSLCTTKGYFLEHLYVLISSSLSTACFFITGSHRMSLTKYAEYLAPEDYWRGAQLSIFRINFISCQQVMINVLAILLFLLQRLTAFSAGCFSILSTEMGQHIRLVEMAPPKRVQLVLRRRLPLRWRAKPFLAMATIKSRELAPSDISRSKCQAETQGLEHECCSAIRAAVSAVLSHALFCALC